MAKKKTARKTSKGKKKTAPKKPAAKKTARKSKSTAKRSSSRRKAKAPGTAVLEIAEIDVIAEPEEVAGDDEFPPDYGGSE
jgi:hypothetical protein